MFGIFMLLWFLNTYPFFEPPLSTKNYHLKWRPHLTLSIKLDTKAISMTRLTHILDSWIFGIARFFSLYSQHKVFFFLITKKFNYRIQSYLETIMTVTPFRVVNICTEHCTLKANNSSEYLHDIRLQPI